MKSSLILILLFVISMFFTSSCSNSGNDQDNGIGGTGSKVKSPSIRTSDFDINLIATASSGKKEKKIIFVLANQYGLSINNNIKDQLKTIINIFDKLNSSPSQSSEFNTQKWALSIDDKNYELSANTNADKILWQLVDIFEPKKNIILKGISNLSVSEGSWVLLQNEISIIHINWKISETEQLLTIEDLNSDSLEFSTILRFHQNNQNINITYFNKTNLNLVEILWNQESGIGGIRDPLLNDGKLSMWDEHHEDYDIINNEFILPSIPLVNTVNLFSGISTLKSALIENLPETNSKDAENILDSEITNSFPDLFNIFKEYQALDAKSTPQQSENKFIWAQDFTSDANEVYQIKMTAEVIGEKIRWLFQNDASSPGTFTDVLLGYSNKSSNEGNWALIKKNNQISINYCFDDNSKKLYLRKINEDSQKSVTNINIEEDFSIIKYEIYKSESESLKVVEWNKVKNSGHFFDSLISQDIFSWDSNFKNN